MRCASAGGAVARGEDATGGFGAELAAAGSVAVPGLGAGAAGWAEGAAAGAPERNASTSRRMIRPPGPVPRTRVRSTWDEAAILRASGLTLSLLDCSSSSESVSCCPLSEPAALELGTFDAVLASTGTDGLVAEVDTPFS